MSLVSGVIVEDDTFLLNTYLMKLYSHKRLIYAQKAFNFKLSIVRHITEYVSGTLVSQFRPFEAPIACNVNTNSCRTCST